jgi:hypothetical protein
MLVQAPTYLLDALIAKNKLRELLDLLYDELEITLIGVLD